MKNITAKEILVYLTIKNKGDWKQTYDDIKNKVDVKYGDAQECVERLEKEGWKTTTMIDSDYPETLKHSARPPFVLFCKGADIKLHNFNKSVYVGKATTEYEKEQRSKTFCGLMAFEKLAISLHKVFDDQIQLDSLMANTTMRLYPYADVSLSKETESVAAKLSKSVIAISNADCLSVATALSEGRDIYSLPHNNGEEGKFCNEIIEQGATPYLNTEDQIMAM